MILTLIRAAWKLYPTVLSELVKLAVALAKGQTGEDEAARVLDEQRRVLEFDEIMRERHR